MCRLKGCDTASVNTKLSTMPGRPARGAAYWLIPVCTDVFRLPLRDQLTQHTVQGGMQFAQCQIFGGRCRRERLSSAMDETHSELRYFFESKDFDRCLGSPPTWGGKITRVTSPAR